MKAYLIGERSAGMTAIEIYDDGALVWAKEWFQGGCTKLGYIAGLCEAFDCLRNCADVADFEVDGGEYDEDGNPVPFDVGTTTGVMLSYDTDHGWRIGDDARRMGQGIEIVDACILAGLVDADAGHDPESAGHEVVSALVRHIQDGRK